MPTTKKEDPAKRVLEMAKDAGILKSTAPEAPPKKRGRPPGSTSKSPSRKVQATAENVDAAATLEKMRKKKVLRQLRALTKHFPEYAEELKGFNAQAASAEELQAVIDEIKDSIHVENEINMIPGMFDEAISNIESGLLYFGATSEHEGARQLLYLQDLQKHAKYDAALQQDIKLISTELMGLMPTNPTLRFFINFGRVIMSCYRHNKMAEMQSQGAYDDL